MRFTIKSSYGVRALVDLAIMYEEDVPVPLSRISREEGISNVYLEQLFHRMKKDGLVKSVRGPRGGYILKKRPEDITVYDVVSSLEPASSGATCVGVKEKPGHCSRAALCASKAMWAEVDRKVAETLSRFDLAKLARMTLKKDPEKKRFMEDRK